MPLQAVCYTKVAGYTGLGEIAPSMDEMNKFIDEKVLKNTLEEIILKNGQFQSALSLYSDRTHLYFQPTGKFIMMVLRETLA